MICYPNIAVVRQMQLKKLEINLLLTNGKQLDIIYKRRRTDKDSIVTRDN